MLGFVSFIPAYRAAVRRMGPHAKASVAAYGMRPEERGFPGVASASGTVLAVRV